MANWADFAGFAVTIAVTLKEQGILGISVNSRDSLGWLAN